MSHLFRTVLSVCCLITLVACGGSSSSGGASSVADDSGGNPNPVAGSGEIRVLSNRADLISGGDVLLEVLADAPANLSGAAVAVDGRDVSSAFALRENGRFMGLVEGLSLGSNEIVVTLADASILTTSVTNHPKGGPVFSGPQVEPWTCDSAAAEDAQCNQAPSYRFKYVPADRIAQLLTGFDPETQQLPDAFEDYDPENPPPAEDIAVTTTDEGVELPFIVRVEVGFINRDRYQIMTLFRPGESWDAFAPQSQWNHKLLIHHGGNVGVSYGPGNPPNGDISGTFPEGLELLIGDSITVALGRGFVTLSTAQSNLGHNVNLVTSAESLMMAKEYIVENYGELRYTLGTGCSGGAIAQQHVANAYPGIYQGLVVQCSYPDVWTTATQFADYNLLNHYFGNTYPTSQEEFTPENFPMFNNMFLPFVQWSLIYGHLPINPVVSDLAFFPSAFPEQEDCPGLRDGVTVYNADTAADGLRCGLIDYMKTQFGERPPAVWSPNEVLLGRGFTGLPLDNVGVQYGLAALQQGFITGDQFLDLNRNIGGFNVDVHYQAARTEADPEALSNIYRVGGVNTAEHLDSVPIIDLRGPDPGIAHDSYHSWQTRARINAKQGHFDNHVIWFGQAPVFGDSTYASEALLVMDRWVAAIEADNSSSSLPEKVVANKPAAARDRCLSAQSSTSEYGVILPLTGNLLFPDPIIPADTSQIPPMPPESGQVFDQVANQVCGLDASAYDETGQSALLFGPIADQQELIVQTRFGTPRTVAGDNIQTLTNKCQLKNVSEQDYEGSPLITDIAAFIAQVQEIFPRGVCDYSLPPVGVVPTQVWLQYGDANTAIIGGEPLPLPPESSRGGWASPAFGLER